jgi:hypothetical protein
MLVSDLTKALQAMPQDSKIMGVFVQRQGELDSKRIQNYKVRIVSTTESGMKNSAQFEYSAYIPEKKEEKPLKQRPFAGLKPLN